MKITLLCIGKTDSKELNHLILDLKKRIPNYTGFQIEEINFKLNKKLSPEELKKYEGNQIFDKLTDSDYLILLDEKGANYTSVEFSKYIQNIMNNSIKHLVFCVGGAYGFSNEVYNRANDKISLSKMTFTHQMVRFFFVEQLYRAFSIIEGKPYHNE